MRDVMDLLRAKVPDVMAQVDVASHRRIAARVGAALDLGWHPDELVSELTRKSFARTYEPVGVLIGRLKEVIEGGGDYVQGVRAELAETQRRSEQAQARRNALAEEVEQERSEERRWTAELEAAMPDPDERAELLDRFAAGRYPGRGATGGAWRSVARVELQEAYETVSGELTLPEFLADLRGKLDRPNLNAELHEATA